MTIPFHPSVDVVIPVRNGARDLARAFRSVAEQDYPGTVHVVMAVGPSTDDTWNVAAALAERHPRVTVVENPSGLTPVALNLAIAAGQGEVVLRLDAQGVLPEGYIRRAVELLDETGAVNVGGVQRATGHTSFERAVAAAMNSPLGAGDARFRLGGDPGPTDTVYLGVFRRSAVEDVGGFDETLVRNQDYELNWRLRQRGGVVYFHPDLEVAYRPRGSLRALARQYFDYGRWKHVMLRRHPSSVRWRQLVPPVVAVANVTGLALLPVTPWSAVVPLGYVIGVALGAVMTSPDRSVAVLARLPVVLATMHHAWATGFLSPAPHRVRHSSLASGRSGIGAS